MQTAANVLQHIISPQTEARERDRRARERPAGRDDDGQCAGSCLHCGFGYRRPAADPTQAYRCQR